MNSAGRARLPKYRVGRPAGVYLLSIFDVRGGVIAVTAVSVH